MDTFSKRRPETFGRWVLGRNQAAGLMVEKEVDTSNQSAGKEESGNRSRNDWEEEGSGPSRSAVMEVRGAQSPYGRRVARVEEAQSP